jgi:prevent-host-death family protein
MTSRKKQSNRRTPRLSFLALKAQEIGAAEFKSRCLELMDEVAHSGTEFVITKHRKPIARLVPAKSQGTKFCGALKTMVRGHGDLVSPTGAVWEANESDFA